ncbi:MAG: AMP-dependent synthetase [Anaeromyxobacter sp. RBG_16_69_14]|nr:MAG: AMP-dependent synthetase [Anaeromyxobacter sp. RBG_16_69_14]
MRLCGPPQPAPRAPDVNALLAQAAPHPSGVTFLDLHERELHLRWAEIHARARRVAASLETLGVCPGDRVAVILRTEPAFVDALFGTLLAGAVPVPLYPPVRLGRMEEYLSATARMIRVSGARLVLANGAVRRLLGEVVARARPELGCRSVEGLERSGRELARAVDPGDLALVQFSSGSTVDPKPVALTHASVVAHTAAILDLVRPTPDDKLVSWLPLYHDMGLIGCLLGAASYPGPLVLIPPEHFLARPALWLRALARHRGTVSAAPSFAYAYAAERVRDEDLEGLDLSQWRIALDGAEPVAAEVLRRFAARFARFGFDARALMPVYGLSEAALAVTFTPRRDSWRSRRLDPVALASRGDVEEGRREVVSVGTPIPGVEVEVRGASGEVLPERRLGRVFVRGASVMRGYLGQPEATARALRGGWLDTGDLGFVEGGELYVHGRAKDVVILRGANHAPDELEAPLQAVAGIRPGCAVAVGFQPDDSGEELLLLAERAGRPGEDPAVEGAARRAVLERTGVRPHAVVLLPPGTLPRTSSGKMRRGEALRRYLAGELAPPRQVTALTVAREMARSALAYARMRHTRDWVNRE